MTLPPSPSSSSAPPLPLAADGRLECVRLAGSRILLAPPAILPASSSNSNRSSTARRRPTRPSHPCRALGPALVRDDQRGSEQGQRGARARRRAELAGWLAGYATAILVPADYYPASPPACYSGCMACPATATFLAVRGNETLRARACDDSVDSLLFVICYCPRPRATETRWWRRISGRKKATRLLARPPAPPALLCPLRIELATPYYSVSASSPAAPRLPCSGQLVSLLFLPLLASWRCSLAAAVAVAATAKTMVLAPTRNSGHGETFPPPLRPAAGPTGRPQSWHQCWPALGGLFLA